MKCCVLGRASHYPSRSVRHPLVPGTHGVPGVKKAAPVLRQWYWGSRAPATFHGTFQGCSSHLRRCQREWFGNSVPASAFSLHEERDAVPVIVIASTVAESHED